ncbi:hypothetical protein HXX76_006865 [Chlamydomonas incerta]|uniref:Uncharacterized protein n=1 Tax=Chlamydomonas incerta TaxID=51695 RepID=A0A835T447_CHLIN|nr:hypothetical protein HXX76_006865 [Chlamydomonas incerta]|eukprot:KAG2435663.1 hypothetical protein HXX76_006865 [Chlamydomonas incerta]
MLEVSIQLREASGLYFAKAPSADAAGNVIAVTSRFLPDACPMVAHVMASEAATADCAGRKTKLDFAVPLALFNCSAYVLDDFYRGFFLQLRVYVATQPCALPTDVIYAGPAVNALEGKPGCTYAAITGGCKPSTCPGWSTDLAAQQAAQLAAAKGTPAAQSVAARSAASSASSQEEQWKTIVPAVVGAAVGAVLVAAIVAFLLLRNGGMVGGKRRREGEHGGRRAKRADGAGGVEGNDGDVDEFASALQPRGHYDEDLLASPAQRGMDLNDEEELKAARGSAAPYEYDSGAESTTHARTLGLRGGSQTFWGLSGHWLRSPRFGGLGASGTGGEMARLRPHGGLDSAAASPTAPSSPGVHFVRMRAHGLDDTVSRSAALLPRPHGRPSMAAGATAAAAQSGAASPGLGGMSAGGGRSYTAPYYPGGAAPGAMRGVSTAPSSPGWMASGGGSAARAAVAARAAAASVAAYAAANVSVDSQRDRREREALGELVSQHSPPIPRHGSILGSGVGATSRLAHETRPLPALDASATAAAAAQAARQRQHRTSAPGNGDLGGELAWKEPTGGAAGRGSGPTDFYNDAGHSPTGAPRNGSPSAAQRAAVASGRGVYVHGDSYNSPQIYTRSAAATAAAGTAVHVSAGSIQRSPSRQASHHAPAGLVSMGASITTAPHSPSGVPTGGGFLGVGPSPVPSSTGGRYAPHTRAAATPGGGAVELAGRQRAATDTGEGMLLARPPPDARTSASGVPTGGARGAWTALWGGGGAGGGASTSGGAPGGVLTGWALPPSSNASAEPQVQITVESAAAAGTPAPPSPGRSRWLGAGARAALPSRLGRVQQPLEPAAGTVYGTSPDGSPDRLVGGHEPQVAVVLDKEGGGSASNSRNSSSMRGRMAAVLRARSSRNGGFEAPPRRSAPGMGTLDELGTSEPTVAISLQGPEGPNSAGGGGGLLSRIGGIVGGIVGGIRSPAAQGEAGMSAGASGGGGGTGSAGNTGTVRSLFRRSPQSSDEEKQA